MVESPPIIFKGRGANVVGSLGSGSLVQDMPTVFQFPTQRQSLGAELPIQITQSSASGDPLQITGAITMEMWFYKAIPDRVQEAGANYYPASSGTTSNDTIWQYSINAGYTPFRLGINSSSNPDFRLRLDNETGTWGEKTLSTPAAYQFDREFEFFNPAPHHLVGTYDGVNTMAIYIDGVQVTSSTAYSGTMDDPAIPNWVGYLKFGGTGGGDGSNYGAYAMPGNYWDFRVWDRAHTAAEVEYNFKNQPLTTGSLYDSSDLQLWLPGTGSALDDIGPNNLDSSITSGSNLSFAKDVFKLNQIGSGSVSGAATISGGTWNLRDSTYMSFDGVDNYIDSNTNLSTVLTGSHTISTWCKLTDGHPTSTESLWGSRNSPLDDSCELYIGSTGKITYWYMAGGVDEYASSDAAVFVDNATGWHHVVATMEYIDSSNATMKLYVDGNVVVLGSSDGGFAGNMANWSSSIAMAFGGSNNNDVPERFLDGKMRDFRVYNSDLTSSQIDLLYKGQWDGTPVHWWKLNDGSGDTIVDSGLTGTNGTNNDATWVNPTYTKAGATAFNVKGIHITSGCNISAPRGIFHWNEENNFVHYQVDGPNSWTHNNGTFSSASPTGNLRSLDSCAGTGSVFYTVSTSARTNFGYGDGESQNNYWWIEDAWIIADDKRNGSYSNRTKLVFGTDTTSGSITAISEADEGIGTIDGGKGFGIEAKNELFPVRINSRFYTYNPTNIIYLKNVDWITSEPFGTNSTVYGSATDTVEVILSGNAKFTNLTQADDNGLQRFNFNGYRLECTRLRGAWDKGYTLATTTGSMLVTTGSPDTYNYQIGYATGATDVGELNILFNSDLSENTSVYWNSSVSAGATGPKSVFTNVDNNGFTFGSDSNDQQGARTNFIVGAGTYTGHSGSPAWTYSLVTKNLTMANGGTYAPTSDLIKVSGNFNMAGGFIGQGALYLDGVDEYVDIPFSSELDPAATDTFIWEAWMKSDESANNLTGRIIESGDGGPVWIGMSDTDNADYIYEALFNIYDGVGNITITGTTQVNDDKWHHIAGVLEADGITMNLYVDGKLEGTNTIDAAGPVPSSTDLQLGRYDSGNYLKGNIARASLWKAALTAAEIREMMFYNWVDVSGSSIDQTDCVAWYEFNDSVEGTTISDMSGSGNTGTMQPDNGGWANPGTFTYDTSTLIFDNDGSLPDTYNCFAPRNGTKQYVYGLIVTDGSALYVDNSDGGQDFEIYGPLVNSGATCKSLRNVQYRSTAMPIVKSSSDLKWGSAYFYYFPGVGNTASGAATDYHILATNDTVEMQGDFTAGRLQPYSNSDFHFMGHEGSVHRIYSYSSGNIALEPGSSINFTSTDGFNKDEGGTASYITASGEAAGMFATDAAGTAEENYIEVANSAPLLVPTGACTMSAWVKPDSAALATGTSYLQPVGKINSYRMFINGQGAATAKGELSVQLQDVGNLTGPSTISGNVWTHLAATYDGSNMKIYYNGIEVTSSAATGDIMSSDPRDLWIGKFGTPYRYFVGSIADVRLYSTGLTSGNCLTLASINPATNVNGAIYADPDNDFGALGWWKCGATATGTLDATNYGTSGSTIDGTIEGSAKSGFVTVTGAAGFNPINYPYQDITLTNTYISGMADIVVGQYMAGSTLTANSDATFTTKGTVVLD